MPLSTLLRCSAPTGTDSDLCCARFAGGWFGAPERGSGTGLLTRVLGTPGKQPFLRLQSSAASGCRLLSRVLCYFPWVPGENLKLYFRAPRWFRAGVPQQRGVPRPACPTDSCLLQATLLWAALEERKDSLYTPKLHVLFLCLGIVVL